MYEKTYIGPGKPKLPILPWLAQMGWSDKPRRATCGP